ncbi:MAG: HAD family phosphatase [Clostridia bacterium]|nr:HAD family phosphatase [Clostridia bacterium]
MIKNYIFDFGNVLARFDTDALTAVAVKDEKDREIVRNVIFDRLYWDRLDAGTITDEEVKEGFRSRLPERLYGAACEAYDRWTMIDIPVPGMPELVKDIKKNGGKLFLLSNISIGFAENYHKNPFASELFSRFDGLVFSGPLGITKPNKEIFEYLLKTYLLNAEDCIFVDDREDNIAGAEAAGIKGYLFDGDAEKLRKILNV